MLSEYKPYSIKIKDKPFTISKPLVMGILNTTDDSFFDGGKYHTIDKALNKAESLLKEGADIIDIGAQSSRPGAENVDPKVETERSAPLIEAIRKRFPDTIISIDTYRALVAKNAVESGADIVNDISAGEDDVEMLETVASLKVPYIAMHKKGLPKTMQDDPRYVDVVNEVYGYFRSRMILFEQMGIKDCIIDPGFGFGKTMQHNYTLMKHLSDFSTLNRPMLVGISRKSMIYKLLETDAEHAMNGSSVLHTIALLQGAHILRVHDVREAIECVRMLDFLRKA